MVRMKPHDRTWRRAWHVAAVLSCCASTAPALAQGENAPTESWAAALRAELTAPRRLYTPQRPAWVQLTLRNVSEEVIEIPLTAAPDAEGPITLPPEIVFGTPHEPALSVAYQEEKPTAVPPPAAEAPASQRGLLRLGPHGSLGVEIDLREYFPALRYSGNYRVEWRPLGGRVGSATATFRVEARKDAVLVTDKGKLTFTLFYDAAPRHVENFLELVRDGAYDGKTVHRIIPGFLIQGGCPKGDGTGLRPDGKLLPAEFHNAPFQVGTLAMARKPSDPNSASCQFFIMLARVPELDGQYTVIGQASDEESLRTLNQIAAEPTDARGRPRAPLIIRSINLVDAEQSGTTRLDVKPTRSPAKPASPPAQQTKPNEP